MVPAKEAFTGSRLTMPPKASESKRAKKLRKPIPKAPSSPAAVEDDASSGAGAAAAGALPVASG